MLRSMTGFGRASTDTKKGRYVIEVQSVNRRFLDASIFLPREYSSLEIEIRKIISKKLNRGQIIVRLNFYPSDESVVELLPDIKFLKKLKKEWETRASELKLSKEPIDISFLSQQLKIIPMNEKSGEIESDSSEIFKCLNIAIDKLTLMKEKEGAVLFKDILKRLKLIESCLSKIENEKKNATLDFEIKLKQRLSEFFEGAEKDERIVKEIALYADKVDITEELIRLNSHIKQFYLLGKMKEVNGRKMDFLIQEMVREVNTISSKSSSKEVSIFVVDIKSELEKIREQVQNIE